MTPSRVGGGTRPDTDIDTDTDTDTDTDFAADADSDAEELDALIIGAGLSGIAAAHHLQAECPWASYAIVEARSAIGGTWDLFRYPGVRSDSDMFTLGYPFRPWASLDAIGDGETIRTYIEDTAKAEGIDTRIRFGRRVEWAEWCSDDEAWTVTIDGDGHQSRIRCRFLISCTGYYRYDRGYQPDFAGRDRFGGQFVHPQFWPDDLDHDGARVVVIGSGATAVTLVPAMAETAERVTMVQRSPTYIAPMPRTSGAARTIKRLAPKRYAPTLTRWVHALSGAGFYQFCRRFPGRAGRFLVGAMARSLPDDYDVATHFTPTYAPWDQRLCLAPDGDLFKTIAQGRAEVVTDTITTLTETGLELGSGRHLDADIIVSATGLELLFLGGIELVVDGEPVEVSDRMMWKGMMLEGVPNLVAILGYTNASWTLKADMSAAYAARLLNRLDADGLASATPRPSPSTAGFTEALWSVDEPILPLEAGYVRRAAGRFPRQGRSSPWRVRQNFLADWWSVARPLARPPVLDAGLQLAGSRRRVSAGLGQAEGG